MELKLLIFTQILIDIAMIVAFVFLLKRLGAITSNPMLNKGLDIFEAMLRDVDTLVGKLDEQVKEKGHLIKLAREDLDKKFMAANLLLKKAGAVLVSPESTKTSCGELPVGRTTGQEKEIINLAAEGYDVQKIADALFVPKEEVNLVLNMEKKNCRRNMKEPRRD